MRDPVTATDWDARAYHELSEPQLAWGRRVLAGIGLRGDETVLDVGCGTGRLTAELIECLPRGRVVALDVSASMLQVAQAALASRFGRRVRFVRADAASLPLKEAADLVFSTATFRAHMARLPPELQPRFAEALAEQAASDDPPFSLDYWRLNLRGTKA